MKECLGSICLIGKLRSIVFELKVKTWYYSIFTHTLDVALVNAHTIYNLIHGDTVPIDLLNLRSEATLCLLKMETPSKLLAREKKVVHVPKRVMKLVGIHRIERTLKRKQINLQKECKKTVFSLQCRISRELFQ